MYFKNSGFILIIDFKKLEIKQNILYIKAIRVK
nr:MAG TPA: hypothetical protein [Caudoviricetes sp.]